MSVSVSIPTQLRSLTNGADRVDASAGTVGTIIADIEAQHPGVQSRLVDQDGKLRRFVNVYVDDEDVRFLKGLDTEVPEGAKLSIIPAVAGG